MENNFYPPGAGINALNAITKFYFWLPPENPIKYFINTHCLHLLNSDLVFLGQKHTGILTSLYTVKSMLSNNKILVRSLRRRECRIKNS